GRAAGAGRVGPLGDFVVGVALDRVDGAVGVDRFDQADVLAAPDDQVARFGRAARRGDGAAARFGPAPEGGDGLEAFAVFAQRGARLGGAPGGEVGAPGADHGALHRTAVFGDPGRVVGARRHLRLADLGPRRFDRGEAGGGGGGRRG